MSCVSQNLAWKNKENFVLAFCECVWFHDYGYSRCKITKQAWDTLVKMYSTNTIATLMLGSRPRQRVGRWRAKKKTRKSFHMPPGVQRMWGHEPSHSQVNSHVGSWSPERTPESSERDCRGQNSSPWVVFYITGKILKCKCLKWARIAHLDICNGRESNW